MNISSWSKSSTVWNLQTVAFLLVQIVTVLAGMAHTNSSWDNHFKEEMDTVSTCR
jgi:hypothetical protein